MILSREVATQLKDMGWEQEKHDGGIVGKPHTAGGYNILASPSLEQLLEDFREREYGYALCGYKWEGQSKYNFATWHNTLDIYAEDSGRDPTELVAQAWIQEFGSKA